jgi:c-di-AMP phosphodiesterase-like protein
MTRKRSPKSLESIYRAILAMRKDMETQLAIIRLDQHSDRLRNETVLMLVDHCTRLVHEKEILQRRCAMYEANKFMAIPTLKEPV